MPSTHDGSFPDTVPLKVFLRPDAAAEAALLDAVTKAAGKPVSSTRQASSGGNFLCLRLTLEADDAQQLDRVRAAIAAQSTVLLAL